MPTNGLGNSIIHCNWDSSAANQLFLRYDSDYIAFRRKAGNIWQNWKTLAFTDSNVASATKLANTITIWGQNFNGEGNVTGALSGATTGTFSSTVSATTGIFSNLTANYIPKHTAGGLTNSLIYDNGTNVGIGRTDPGYKLDVNGTFRTAGIAYFGNNLRIQDSGSYSELIGGVGKSIKFYTNDGVYNPLNLFSSGNVGVSTGTDAGYKLDVNGTFRTTGSAYLNSTLAVTGTSTLTGLLTANGGITAANVISRGAVVAGALNGTLPDDLPVATTSLFGVIKTGLSLKNNVGVVNINGRHYTTASAYTDAAVREITAELVLGTGNMTAGTLDQIQLAFAPLTTTRGLTGNIIATATGAGMSLTISFRKDTGSGRWYLMIYNGTTATVVRNGILISIRGQQTI